MWFQRHEEPKTITDEYEQVLFSPANLPRAHDSVSGDLHILRLREVGPAEKRTFHVRILFSGGQRLELIGLKSNVVNQLAVVLSIKSSLVQNQLCDPSTMQSLVAGFS